MGREDGVRPKPLAIGFVFTYATIFKEPVMKFPSPEKPSLADFPHLVTHTAVPDDPYDQPAGNPPKEPFEALGAQVEKLTWDNRGVKRSLFPMPVPDWSNERLQAFREKYDFLDAIKGVDSEFQRLLLLRNWVNRKIAPNNLLEDQPSFFKRPYPDESFGPFRTLDTAGHGCRWWCPHYSQTLRAVLTACGYVARHVGNISIYSPEEGARTHGVTDVFVQELGKWVQLDAHYDVHYERDGVPLSPYEIGEEWFKNDGKDVNVCVGTERKVVDHALKKFSDQHESCRAYWNQHRWYMDPFSNHGTWFATWDAQLVLTLVGERHEGVVAYRGRNPGSEADAGYSDGRIQYTTREANVYPDIGTSHLKIQEGKDKGKGTIRVQVGTYTPNLEAIEIKVDDRPWADTEVDFEWFPHVGENTLEVRTRNKFGNRGRPSTINAVLKANES